MKIPERIKPKPGQESVWDYPRPPRLEDVDGVIKIVFNRITVAETRAAKRVLETSHPPVYYIPLKNVKRQYLEPAVGSSFCEWKGMASYYDMVVKDRRADKVGWHYPDPTEDFRSLKNHIAFYAGPMDACYINDEQVTPQPGGFYGGWITKNIVGPFKGESGTMFW